LFIVRTNSHADLYAFFRQPTLHTTTQTLSPQMSEEQQKSGGVFSGVTDTVGGITGKATGALGGSGGGSADKEPEHQLTPEQQASAKESQQKGAKGVEPIKEGESDAEIAKRLSAIVCVLALF
jgi:hypothetical protein